jgi:hypothetical protein
MIQTKRPSVVADLAGSFNSERCFGIAMASLEQLGFAEAHPDNEVVTVPTDAEIEVVFISSSSVK